ncbi:MAG TPA: 2Fe-2S iron-sulfur cluster-binding protein [Sphingomonas sp.]|jgi:ferredoxin
MIRIRFLPADGPAIDAEAHAGDRLLDVAQRQGLPLEGTCGGVAACATCHVVVDAADFDRLPPPGEEEADLLDLVPFAVRTSRLSCQITLTPEMDGLTVRVPDQGGF